MTKTLRRSALLAVALCAPVGGRAEDVSSPKSRLSDTSDRTGTNGTLTLEFPGATPWTESRFAYGQQNFWVASGPDSVLFRFAHTGSDHKQLPGRVHRVFASGGTANVWLDGEVVKLTGDALSTMIKLPSDSPHPADMIVVGEGVVTVDWEGTLTYHGPRGEHRQLEFQECVASDAGKESCHDLATDLLPKTGTLVTMESDQFAWVRDTPYEIILLNLTGRAKTISVDDHDLSHGANFGDNYLDPELTGRPTRTRYAYLKGDRLFIDRVLSRRVDVPGGVARLPAVFVDVFNLGRETLEKRVHFNKKVLGYFVGVRDADTWVLWTACRDTPDGQSHPCLQYVTWQSLPDWDGKFFPMSRTSKRALRGTRSLYTPAGNVAVKTLGD